MANTHQDILKWVSKADARKEFEKLNDAEAKGFFHDILESLCQMTVQGESKKFRKCARILQEVNTSTKKDLIMTFYDGKHPFHNTNILLLASEYQHQEIFELILTNYCQILNFSSAKLISPTDEDDMGRNAYYYLMRLNKMEMLEMLVEKWPFQIDKHDVDIALSKAYVLLIVQGVNLTTGTRYYVEYTLNKLRLDKCIFGNMKQKPISLKQIQTRSALLIDTIQNLNSSYENNGNGVNEEVLCALKFIALHISVLKRYLHCTYESLPWEEMEFCLVVYIKYFQSEDVPGVYYRAHVNRRNIFRYLKEFGLKVENIVKGLKKADLSFKIDSTDRHTIESKIASSNAVFKELIEKFTKIRNFHSLRRMIFYLDCVLSTDKSKKSKDPSDIFAVERCLQVLGELMKNSPTAPNLSSDLGDSIFACFTDQLQKVIKNMRNSLSHKYGLEYRVGIKSVSLYSYENFMKIKDDLKDLNSLISNFLLREEFDLFEELYFEMTTIQNFQDYEHFKEVFNSGKVNLFSTAKIKNVSNMDITKSLFRTISNSCSNSDISDGINNKVTSCGVMKIFDEFKAETLSSNEKSLSQLFNRLEQILRIKKDIIGLNETKGYSFLFLASTSINQIETYRIDPEKRFTKQWVKSVAEQFGLPEQTAEKSERLSYLEEEAISYILDEIIHTCVFAKHTAVLKLQRYQHKICFLLGIRKKCVNSIKNLDYNFKLTKKTISPNHKFIEDALDSKLDHLRLIFQSYHIDNTSDSIKSFISHYGESQLFLTIEMLLLDILTIYEKCLRRNIGIYDFYFPSLIGKELRNYLAHGNSIVDILDHNAKLCILMNCITFVNGKCSTNTILRDQQSLNEMKVHIKHVLGLVHSKSEFFQILKHTTHSEYRLQWKIDVLSRTMERFTVLHAAAHNSNVRVFQHCLTKMMDDNHLLSDDNSFNQNIIHIAAFCNNFELISYLLRQHPNTCALLSDMDYKGDLPLHYAAMYGEANMIESLLEYDQSDVFVENKLFHKPIHSAIILKNVDTFSVLLKFERNVNEKYIRGGYSIMHYAAESCNQEFISILISRNANVNIDTDGGYTPLHAACFYGRLENVKLLLSKGADPNRKIHETGQTPIYFAIENHHLEIVKLLLDKDADVHAVQKHGHYNLLHAAAAAGNTMIIEELLKRQLGLQERTFGGETILHVAVQCNKFEAVQTILKHKIHLLNATDKCGTSAIHIAAWHSYQDIFEVLLNHGANLVTSDFVFGKNPLQLILRKGNMNIIKYLIKQNISIHEKENWKWAVFSGEKDVVKAVFDKCDPKYIQDNRDKLSEALCVAIDQGNSSILEYLIEKGADIEFLVSRAVMSEITKIPFLAASNSNEKTKPLLLAISGLKSDLVLTILKEYVRVGKTDSCFDAISKYWSLLCKAKDKIALTSIIELFIKYGDIDLHRSKLIDICIVRNNLEALQLLLSTKQDINFKSLFGAIMHGYDEVCKLAMEKGKVDLNGKIDSGMTLLHCAAIFSTAAMAEHLILKGCDVHAKDDNNLTPIDCAASAGNGSVIEVLLRHGAGFSLSLLTAVVENHAGIVEFLLEEGANGNCPHENESPLLYAIANCFVLCTNLLLSRNDIDVNFADKETGHTALHVAAQVGNLEVTKILIEKGANVDAVTKEGTKPIHAGIGNSQLEIVKFYIENEYIKIDEISGRGCTLLHYAANRGNIEMTKYLLNFNVDINAKVLWTGNTPLHIAAAKSSWEKCCLLIDCGAIFAIKNNVGATPLDMANEETKSQLCLISELFNLVERGSGSKVSDLLIIFADMNLNGRNSRGMTVLHIAVLKGYDDIVGILLEKRINVNVKDLESNTALHFAAKKNEVKIVNDLLVAGAIYNLKNVNNHTAIDLTSNTQIRRNLSKVDKYFGQLEIDGAKFMDLFRRIENREDQVRLLFGPRNSRNQDMYTFIVMNKLTDLQTGIEILLNKKSVEAKVNANILASRGEFKRSAEILKPVVKKYEKDYGPMNPLTLEMRSQWLQSLYKINEYDYCLKTNEEIVKEYIRLYGEHSEIALMAREFSALCLHRLGKNTEALEIYEDIRETLHSLLGSSHCFTLQAKQHSVLVLNALRRYEDALRVSDDIYDIQRETLGEDNLSSIITRNNVGLALMGLGKYAEAADIFQEVRRKRQCLLGPKHPDTLRAMHNFAMTLGYQRKYKVAVKELKSVYELQKRVLGERHLETLNTKSTLASLFFATRRTMDATIINEEIYPKMKSVLGGSHPIMSKLEFQQMCANPKETMKKYTEKYAYNEQLHDQEKHKLFDCIKGGRLAEAIALLRQNEELVNLSDQNGTTTLHVTVANDNIRLFTILDNYGANPLALTKKGNSILHIAVSRCNFEMTKAIVELIRKSHSDVFNKFLDEQTITTGKTALHVGAEKNSHEICLFLLQNGATYNSLTKSNQRPVDLTNSDSIRKLLNLIENIFSYVRDGGKSILKMVKEMSSEEIIALKNCRSEKGKTIVQWASPHTKQQIVMDLVKMLKAKQK